VNLTFAEILYPDGRINPRTNLAGRIGYTNGSSWGACAVVPALEADSVYFAGTGNESYTPAFTWHAFQYMAVDLWPVATHGPPTVDNFVALMFHTANDPAGQLEIWNDQLLAIDALAEASFRANWAGGIQSDCPGRERLGYGGDLMVSAEAGMLQFDAGKFYAKRVNDYRDAANAVNGLPETAPYIGIATCDLAGNTGPMPWGSGHSQLALELYQYYGDKRLLADNYNTTQAWIALLNATAEPSGLLSNGLPDFTESRDLLTCNYTLQGTAFFYQQVLNAAKFAAILGDAEYEATMQALAAKIGDAFRAAFYSPGVGVVGNGTLDQQVLGMYMGLVPAEDMANATEQVAFTITANGTHMFTGAFATSYLLRGGPQWGLSDLLYQALAQVRGRRA
jgi:alpha-L-rhamnosidase